MTERLDVLLLERKLASTRTKAQALIRAGMVKVNGQVCRKPGEKPPVDCRIELLAEEHPYVSRGALKLVGALEEFSWNLAGARVLDLGQSTGGFTDCLLRKGATEVVGVEVGHGQLAPSLRADPRVRCWENQDIRQLPPEMLRPPFHFCVADLSFISLRLILPVLGPFLAPGAAAIVLVKPQFELSRGDIGAGGIVRDPELRKAAVQGVETAAQAAGFTVAGKMDSAVSGGDGNREFFLHLHWRSS